MEFILIITLPILAFAIIVFYGRLHARQEQNFHILAEEINKLKEKLHYFEKLVNKGLPFESGVILIEADKEFYGGRK